MKVFRLLVGAAALTLVGCAIAPPSPDVIKTVAQFSPSDLAWSLISGTNGIEGSAVLRTVGGDARTCAALIVSLLPVSEYTAERIRKLYGSDTAGYRSAEAGVLIFDPPEDIGPYERHATCDALGNFSFSNLPDGPYFVVALVTWATPNPYSRYGGLLSQGGYLLQRVDVAGGVTKKIVLAPGPGGPVMERALPPLPTFGPFSPPSPVGQ